MTNLVKKILFLLAVVFTQTLNAQTMQDGLNAMQLEDYDKAIKIFSGLAASNDQVAMLNLGNAYLAKGESTKAMESFKKAYDAKPDGAYALIANGRVMLLENNTAEADKQFAKAAKAGKKDVDALRLIGESYFFGKTKNLTRAEELLKNAYVFKTRDYNTLMSLGYCYKEMPNGGLAAQHYEFANAVDKKNPWPVYMQARVYRQAKLPEKYLQYMEASLQTEDGAGFTTSLRGIAEYWYYTKRNFVKALEAYKNLVAQGKEVTIEDEMQLANCLFLNKDYKGCSEQVEKTMKKDSSKNYLRRLLGYCYYETGEYQKAMETLNDYFKVVTPDKILGTDYEYWAKSIIKTKGDTAVAITNYRKAMKMDSSRWALNRDIGDIYYAQKKFCDAGAAYQLNMDSLLVQANTKPQSTDYFRLGFCSFYCREDSMRYPKALKNFEEVIKLSPNAGLGYVWAGKAASKLDPDIQKDATLVGEFGKAKPFFEKYVEIASVDKEKNKKDLIAALEYLSYYHYVKADAANFQIHVEKLLELDPTNATGVGLKGAGVPSSPTPPAVPIAPATGGGKKE